MSAPYYADATVTLHHGDCLDVLRSLPDASVDAVVTDPPYGLEFMGKEWDGADGFRRSLNPADVERNNPFGRTSRTSPEYRAGQTFGLWCLAWAEECLRVLKPGGHMLAFGGTRTFHRLACAIEDAGFEIRDSIAWLYASGFPKSLNLVDEEGERTGWGTALKPAHEPIVVARKPLAGTVAASVLAHGTGALNIDACRIGDGADSQGDRPEHEASAVARYTDRGAVNLAATPGPRGGSPAGRWPANVILDEQMAGELDAQSGVQRDGTVASERRFAGWEKSGDLEPSGQTYGGEGGASRFFYITREDNEPCTEESLTTHSPQSPATPTTTNALTGRTAPMPRTAESPSGHTLPIDALDARFKYTAKASADERVRVNGTAHPTVKPLALMRWLVRLVTPPGGTVLEPFAGSGTTVEACILEGFRCVAIEREADYLPLIQQRIHRRRDPVAAVRASGDDGGLFDLLDGGVA